MAYFQLDVDRFPVEYHTILATDVGQYHTIIATDVGLIRIVYYLRC